MQCGMEENVAINVLAVGHAARIFKANGTSSRQQKSAKTHELSLLY